MTILIILACALASAWFYRAGGQGKPYASWMRDWVCPLFALIALCQFGFSWELWWVYAIFYGLSGAALSTYWDFTGKDNFFLHGLGCGSAGIILFLGGIPLWILLTRLVICTIGMGLWSWKVGNDVKEEMGRGFLFVI